MENSRKTPRQDRSRALVDAILTAAARVLTKVGVEEATTTRIADRAGVSIGSLYQYFRDREELLGALLERRLEDNLRRFEDELTRTDGSPIKMLDEIVRAGLATYLDQRSFYANLMSYAPLVSRLPSIVRARKRAAALIARKLGQHSEALAPIDPDVASLVIINAFMGVALFAVHFEPASRDSLRVELVRMFGRYLLRQDAQTIDRAISPA